MEILEFFYNFFQGFADAMVLTFVTLTFTWHLGLVDWTAPVYPAGYGFTAYVFIRYMDFYKEVCS